MADARLSEGERQVRCERGYWRQKSDERLYGDDGDRPSRYDARLGWQTEGGGPLEGTHTP